MREGEFVFGRRKVPPPALLADVIVGQFDAEMNREQAFDEDAQCLFQKISPLINTAMEYIQSGKAHQIKFWEGKYRSKNGHYKAFGTTLFTISADERGVNVTLIGRCSFTGLLAKIENFYGKDGLGFIVRGDNYYDYEREKSIIDQHYIVITA